MSLNLNNILKSTILSEGRKEDLYQKYKIAVDDDRDQNDGDWSAYDYFIETDPSGNHKYLGWLMKQNYDNHDHTWGYGDLADLVHDFHRLLPYIDNKDIFSYKTPDDLEYVIELADEKEKTRAKEKMYKKEKVDVYNDDRWRVIVPKTHKASCAYGAGTKWCTTSDDDSYYFDKHTTDAVLFYLIDKTSKHKTNVMYKVALNWQIGWNSKIGEYIARPITEASLWDSQDKPVEIKHVLPLLPEGMIKAMTDYYFKEIKEYNESNTTPPDDPDNEWGDLDWFDYSDIAL